MKFDIIKKDQYLNVCIWSRSQEKNEKDILLGYVSNYLLLSFSDSLNKRNRDGDGVQIHVFVISISLDFYDFLSPFSHSRKCLTTFPNTTKFIKNTRLLGLIFNSLLVVWK